MGMLKKAGSGVLALFAVFTYRVYAPRVNNGRALTGRSKQYCGLAGRIFLNIPVGR
jgi:hypothetical protein